MSSEGVKNDHEKPRLSLLPWAAVLAVVEVLEFGARKYAPDNWRLVPDARRRYFDAALRHLVAWHGGEAHDPESGLHHLAHAAANVLVLLAFEAGGGGGRLELPAQKRKADPGAPLPPSPTPPSTSAPGRSASTLRAARHYFERRERRFRDVPAGMTWESWRASPEGVAWERNASEDVARNACNAKRNTPQHPATDGATPSSSPSHSPSSSENAGELEEEEGAREGESATRNVGATVEAQRATLAPATPATVEAQRATPDAPRDNALEVLARASKGRVSPFAGARDQVAVAAALADMGLAGSELEAFGAALAGDGASKLWPKSEPAKARAALTCGFFLGRSGDARMLADGVTRWREAQQRERDEAAALARIAAPVVKTGPTPDEMVARASEIFRKARDDRRMGVSRAG